MTEVSSLTKVTVVSTAFASANVAPAGPLETVQAVDTTTPLGRPSSLTVPSNATESAGRRMMASTPAFTTGARLTTGGVVKLVSDPPELPQADRTNIQANTAKFLDVVDTASSLPCWTRLERPEPHPSAFRVTGVRRCCSNDRWNFFCLNTCPPAYRL